MLRRHLLASFAVLATASGPALAQEATGDACDADALRLCPDVKPGSGRVLECLRENESRLSEACRAKRQADEERAKVIVREFVRACRTDVQQFCADVEVGGGRILECLGIHQPELTSSCQVQMAKLSVARAEVAAVRRSCTADVERLCQGVPQEAGPILRCLKANESKLSAECTAGARRATSAQALVEVIDDLTSKSRTQEALEILQGVDSVAFSRSQVLVQVDSIQALQAKGNSLRLLFNPQFVFGERNQFALQVKAPLTTFFPYTTEAPTRSGLGAVTVGFAWSPFSHGHFGHYVSLALQCGTGAQAPVGAAWVIQPAYALAIGLARWVSLTTQVVWIRSLGTEGYPEIDELLLEPILVFNLPGRSFLALDTKLAWDLARGGFAPLMKGVAGIFTDRQRSLSISMWYQGALTAAAEAQFFKYSVGAGLAYYFDW